MMSDKQIVIDMNERLASDLTALFKDLNDALRHQLNFKPIETDIDILVVPPGEIPYVTTIPNTLKAVQAIVGGMIGIVEFPHHVHPTGIIPVFVVNKDGKAQKLPGNRHVHNDIIAGTFFVVGGKMNAFGEKEFVSLPDEMSAAFSSRFWTPEHISDEEVAASAGAIFQQVAED